jgi:hypothetical protein
MNLGAQIIISSENKLIFSYLKNERGVNGECHFSISCFNIFFKMFKMACQPSRCISIGLVLSASKVVAILVLASSSLVNISSTFLPSVREYAINPSVFACS